MPKPAENDSPVPDRYHGVSIIKHLSEIHPSEWQTYLSVPGWRMWKSPGLFSFDREYEEAVEVARAKPLAVCVSDEVDGDRFRQVAAKFLKVTGEDVRPLYGTGVIGTGSPIILEPLTEDDVKTIDEQGEIPGPVGIIDRPAGILRPEELERILLSTNPPQKNLYRGFVF